MSLSFNNVGINLSGAKIQVVEVANEGDKFYINRVDEEFFSELLDFNFKEAKIIEILQQAFNEILLRGEFLGKNVTVALPPEIFKTYINSPELGFELIRNSPLPLSSTKTGSFMVSLPMLVWAAVRILRMVWE